MQLVKYRRIKVLLCFSFICIVYGLSCQKDALSRANEFMNQGDFHSALLQLNEIPSVQTSAPLLFKRAKCYFEINELENALVEIAKVHGMGYNTPDMYFVKGRVHHHLGNFKQAIIAFKNYLRESPLDDPLRSEARSSLKNCGAALDILYIEPVATIQNAGPKVNSKYSDERPIESAGKSNRYYFSSKRPEKNQKVASYLRKSYSIDETSDSDIYFTEHNGDEWQKAKRLNDTRINTYKDDKIVDVAVDGTSLYLVRGSQPIELRTESESSEIKRRTELLGETVNHSPHLHFFNDSTVIFASNHLEGFGGYDLYVTVFVNEKWLSPKNLGRIVNSSEDELSPYLSNDGSTLYFSSNRSFSVGGFDVFFANYLFEQKDWSLPKNIGIPINSPGNELDFRISDDGLLGSYTSNRRDGYGINDIYFAYFNEKNDNQDYTVKDLGFVDYPDFYLQRIKDSKQTQKDQIITQKTEQNNIKTSSQEPTGIGQVHIELPTLVQNEEGELLTIKNILKLDQLALDLSQSKDVRLEIMSFSHREGIAEYNLFLSIKNAEKIKEELVSRGIPKKQISIKGFGNFLPLVKNTDETINLFNNRIEFKINLPRENRIITHQPIEINKNYINKGYQVYRTLVDDAISYKIQIATVRQMYRGTALKLYNDVQVEKDPSTNNYLYTIGLYDDFIEANSIMRELSETGITAMKLVAYVDGLRVREQDLVNYVDRYPELKGFIRSITFARPK